MPLPNPGMTFTPFDPLPASDLNDIVENIDYLYTLETTNQTNAETINSEILLDHVESGCVLTGTGYGSTLGWSLTAGVVYIGGKRYTVASATGNVTASRDTYFDLLKPASGTVASLVNTGGNIVTNNLASPALASNSVRMGIIQAGANIASVASINQGQETKLLPIISSVPMQVTDSVGNLICSRDGSKNRLIGLRRVQASQTGIGATPTQITGLTMPIIAPGNRKIRTIADLPYVISAGGISTPRTDIWDGTVGSGTMLQRKYSGTLATSTYITQGSADTVDTLSAGLHTLNVALSCLSNTVGATSVDGNWFTVKAYLN